MGPGTDTLLILFVRPALPMTWADEELMPFCAVLQVSAWCHLIPLTWARFSRQTPQKKMTASLLHTLTTASTGGGLEDIPCVGPKKCVQDPECRTQLPQCLLEKQSAPVDRGSWEREEVTTSLLDMGFSDAHVNELLTVQPGTHPQQLLDIVSELILLGVNPEPVCVALKKSPQLLKLPVLQMKKRSSYLRKLGLGEGEGGAFVDSARVRAGERVASVSWVRGGLREGPWEDCVTVWRWRGVVSFQAMQEGRRQVSGWQGRSSCSLGGSSV